MKALFICLSIFLSTFTQTAYANQICYSGLTLVNLDPRDAQTGQPSNYGLPLLPTNLQLYVQPYGTKHIWLNNCIDTTFNPFATQYNVPSNTLRFSIGGTPSFQNEFLNGQSYYMPNGSAFYIYNYSYFKAET